MDRRQFIVLSAAGMAAPLLGDKAFADTKYPAGNIRLIVPYAAGGVVDAVARNWGERMRQPLGTLVVENQGGGGGIAGLRGVARRNRAVGVEYRLELGQSLEVGIGAGTFVARE